MDGRHPTDGGPETEDGEMQQADGGPKTVDREMQEIDGGPETEDREMQKIDGGPETVDRETTPIQGNSPSTVHQLPSNYFAAVYAIAWKDLAAELRSRELLTSMLVFTTLIIMIFYFALDLDIKAREYVTAGILWVTFAFAGTIGLNRAMSIEKDRGCLDGLLLAPVDRSAIYFGKMVSSLVFMLIVEIITLPVYSLFYNVNLFNIGLLAVILLGSIGYTAVGTLLSTMTAQARTRDMLLPILLFPVIIPVLVASVKASSGFLQGAAMVDIWPWLNILMVYDIIFLALAFIIFDFVVEE